jgi:HemY protein
LEGLDAEALRTMIRVIVFLVFVGCAALGATWLADRPGEVAITWSGWRIETSVTVLAVAVAAVILVALVLWSLIGAILATPNRFSSYLRRRRALRGQQAISKGLIAIGAGDMRVARKFADEATRLSPGEPLTLLLSAQTAQMQGNRAVAERTFREMASRDDTKLLGLRGLYVEAQRRADADAARLYAEEAARAGPSLTWAGQAVLEFRCLAGDWAGALEAIEANRRSKLLDKPDYLRQRAVLLTAQAQSLAEADRDAAQVAILEAVKLAPAFVPAAALAGRLLAEAGERRKASRILEKAWHASPHPDLAEAYANLNLGDSARDRLKRVTKLADMAPGHVEGALAVARAAMDAREFAVARKALDPLLAQPTRRVAILMAEIEETEHADEGRAREWIARALHAPRDPAWTADGIVADRWMPISPVSGRLDAFAWKVPLAEIASGRAVAAAEAAAEAPPVIEALPAAPAEAPPEVAPEKPEPVPAERPFEEPRREIAEKPIVPARLRPAAERPPERVAAVIPLVHVPDDPGPDHEPEPEPMPEKAAESSLLSRLFSK